MPIHYALFETNITSDPNDFAAVLQVVDSADLDRTVQRMIERGSTTTTADILGISEDAIGTCESMLQDGVRVNWGGLVELCISVKASFFWRWCW